ncbi:MAG: SDR family NAD(P)-dependent oxidoreductase, partial [Candidatus Heimdallarchaeota archaeon]|nr:SDR family NAD(P)-dependent oxidoreductase [Candidatus Heimdallarchaeota archaeon]
VHRVTKTFFPMILSSRGRIIMVGSFFGVLAFPFSGSYSASKAAEEMYVDTLRRELLTVSSDVKVINIWPGPIKTAVWQKSLIAAEKYIDPNSIFTETFQKIMSLAQTPPVEPEEVAQAILKSLTVKKPKIKYSPGMNKFPLRRLKYFPAIMTDKILQRAIKRQIKSS